MCYAIIELTPIGLKQPLVASNHGPLKLDTLSQHAVEMNHSWEVRHAIPACTVQTSYLGMHCEICTVQKRLQKPKTVDKLAQQNNCRTRRDLHKKSK